MHGFDIKHHLRGIVASLHTPFTADNQIDTPSIERLIEHCVDSGCSGVLVAAVAGEVSALSDDERALLLKTVVDSAQQKIHIVVGVSAASIDESVKLAADAAAFNVPVLMWQPPDGLDTGGLINALTRLSDTGTHQIMLQDLDWHGSGIAPDTIAEAVSAVPALTAVKVETAPAGPKYASVAAATHGQLHLSGGWAVMQMLEGLARGLDAFIPSGLLSTQVRIFNTWHAGKREEARRLFEQMLPVMAFTNQHIDISMRFWKYVRVKQGIFSDPYCRLPAPLDDVQLAEVDYMYKRVVELEELNSIN